MTYAAKQYVKEDLGGKYTNFRPPEFAESYKETSSRTAVFFILSPGVDPTRVNIIILVKRYFSTVYFLIKPISYFN